MSQPMMGRIHPDAVDLDNSFEVAYAVYHRYRLVKCTTSSSVTRWTVLVPSEDLVLLREEMGNPDTAICLGAFISALKTVYSFQGQARRGGGEYTSEGWRDIIRRRGEQI